MYIDNSHRIKLATPFPMNKHSTQHSLPINTYVFTNKSIFIP